MGNRSTQQLGLIGSYNRYSPGALAALTAILVAGAAPRTALADDLTFGDRMVKVDPEPDRPTAKPMTPPWCSHVTGDDFGGGKLKDPSTRWQSRVSRSMDAVTERGFYENYTYQIGSMLCAHPDAPEWKQQTGYFVQLYVNVTGLDVKRATAAIGARVDQVRWQREKQETCNSLKVSPEASPEQQRYNNVKREVLGCDHDTIYWRSLHGSYTDNLEWYLDRYPEIDSEMMKSYLVLTCLGDGRKLNTNEVRYLAPYALCGIDARSLDWNKLEKELRAGSYNTYAKTLARETFAMAQAANLRTRKVVDQLIKQDPTYRKIFYTAPETAWKEWVEFYQANKSRYDAVYAFEPTLYGPSKKALDGCNAQFRKQLADYVVSQKPKTLDDFKKVAQDRMGAVILRTLALCAAHEAGPHEMFLMNDLLDKAADVRGPRYAAFYAVADLIGEIRSDRDRFPLTVDKLVRKKPVRIYDRFGQLSKDRFKRTEPSDQYKAVVKGVKKVKDGVMVSFKTEKWKEEDIECVDSNRVWRIGDSGDVHYFQDCTSKGMKTVKHTEKQVIIPAYAADGIKKGSFMVFYADYPYDAADYLRYGFPIAVYKTKKQKVLVSGYGIKL